MWKGRSPTKKQKDSIKRLITRCCGFARLGVFARDEFAAGRSTLGRKAAKKNRKVRQSHRKRILLSAARAIFIPAQL